MPQNLAIDNTGPGNWLVPSGNMVLPEPLFTEIHVAIWRHVTTMSELIGELSWFEIWG